MGNALNQFVLQASQENSWPLLEHSILHPSQMHS